MTHADKVYELLKDGNKHCQNEFHAFSWSPHKRRADAERKYGIKIQSQDCQHSIPGSRDYWISEFPPVIEKKVYRPMTDSELQIAKQSSLFR